jgi:hypothetical protein
MSSIKPLILTDESVVLMVDGNLKEVKNSHGQFQNVVNLIKQGKLQEALDAFDITSKLNLHSSHKFYVLDGVVYLNASKPEPLPAALSDRVIAFADNGLDFQPLVNFWNNLKQNPSRESVKDLYAFLLHNNIPITKDGCFVAYKRVNDKYMDIQTGKFDNHPGKSPSMDRADVDADRNVTCSRGLHVAAFNYANSFYPNGHLMEIKVNPADVVSVPVDYNNEKMRVCKYYVVKECAGPREEPLYTDDDSYNNEPDFDDGEEQDEDHFDNPLYDVGGKLIQDTKDLSNDEEIEVFPDSDGRVGVPASMVRDIGLSYGKPAYIYSDDDAYGDLLYISKFNNANGGEQPVATYFVDSDNKVRISKKVLKSVNMSDAADTNLNGYYFNVVDKEIEIRTSPR